MINTIKYILEKTLSGQDNNEVTIYEQKFEEKDDKDQAIYKISCEFLPASFKITELSPGEFFLEDLKKYITQNSSKSILIIPPFLSWNRLSVELMQAYQYTNFSSICLKEIISILPNGTTLGAVLPQSFLVNHADKEIRDLIVNQTHIEYLIELNNKSYLFPNVDSYTSLVLLILKIDSDKKSPIKFFKIQENIKNIDPESIKNDFSALLKSGGGKTKYGFTFRGHIEAGKTFNYDTYHPDLTNRQKEISEYGQTKILKDFCDINVGLNTRKYNESITLDLKSEGIPILNGKSILSSGIIDPDTITCKLKTKESSINILETGDVCIRQISNIQNILVFAEVTKDMPQLIASNNILVLRFKDSISLEEKELILGYLHSDFVHTWLKAHSSTLAGAVKLSINMLNQLPVPSFDDDLKNAFKSLTNAIKDFDIWKKAAEESRNSIFKSESARDSRLYLLATGREARQRHEAAKLIDDFNYRIRTQFPHPIAYRWRTVLSSYENTEGYYEVLECAEGLICYLAHIAIVLSQHINLPIQYLQTTIAKRLETTSHGTNLGDWYHILQAVRDSKKLSKITGHIPFYEVRTFLNSSTEESLKIIKNHRNDLAHGRGPKGEKNVAKAFEITKKALENLLKNAEFIAEYPLRYIENTKRNSIKKITIYEYRELMGDHPLVPVQTNQDSDPELEAGSLYLVDRDNKSYLLRPLLSRRQCPECGLFATFFLDKYDQKETSVILKSMEHGHTARDSSSVSLFRDWGFLSQYLTN